MGSSAYGAKWLSCMATTAIRQPITLESDELPWQHDVPQKTYWRLRAKPRPFGADLTCAGIVFEISERLCQDARKLANHLRVTNPLIWRIADLEGYL